MGLAAIMDGSPAARHILFKIRKKKNENRPRIPKRTRYWGLFFIREARVRTRAAATIKRIKAAWDMRISFRFFHFMKRIGELYVECDGIKLGKLEKNVDKGRKM